MKPDSFQYKHLTATPSLREQTGAIYNSGPPIHQYEVAGLPSEGSASIVFEGTRNHPAGEVIDHEAWRVIRKIPPHAPTSHGPFTAVTTALAFLAGDVPG